MPIQNLQLLLRPTPGGLHEHHNFLSAQAGLSLRSELFSDLVILTPDGSVSCHQSLLAPLSPLLCSLLSSYPPFPGLMHTLLIPIKLLTVKNILQVIYSGMISLRTRTDMDDVLAGLQVLGIHLPGLECQQSAAQNYSDRGTSTHLTTRQALGLSLPSVIKDVPENNNVARMNILPLPFSVPSLPQSTSSLHQSIVQLPSHGQVYQDIKPNIVSNLHPLPNIGLVDLQTEQEHQFEAFKCVECNKGFKHKKALEIHRIKDHYIENPERLNGEIRDNVKAVEGNTRVLEKRKSCFVTDTEIPPPVSSVLEIPLICTLCQAPLPTEWYRHPRRHKCPHATPRSTSHSCDAVTVSSTTPVQDLSAISMKSQASTSKKRSRSSSSQVSRKRVCQLSCEGCTDTFSSLVSLRTHYTESHYWDRIAAQFATWGPHCYICLCTFPSPSHLMRHMGNFHSYVDQCLVEDGLQFISMETTIKLLSLECGLCGDVKATSAELKNHLSYVHFSKELEREFPGDHPVHKNKKCDRCGKIFNSSSARIKHVGSFHDQVLKYAKSFINVDDVDKHYIPENNFAEGDEISGEPFEDEDTAPLAKWEPLSFPKSPVSIDVEKDSAPSPIKAKIDEVSESSIVKPVPSAESPPLHPCPLNNCSRQCSTRKDLLVHLAMVHYLKELEKQFGTGCGGSRCAQCDVMLPSNKQVYLRHMAVQHEIVMTYVERDMALDTATLPGTVEVTEQATEDKD